MYINIPIPDGGMAFVVVAFILLFIVLRFIPAE